MVKRKGRAEGIVWVRVYRNAVRCTPELTVCRPPKKKKARHQASLSVVRELLAELRLFRRDVPQVYRIPLVHHLVHRHQRMRRAASFGVE